MPTDYQINIRLDEEDETVRQFEKLMATTVRNKTDMFRFMVRLTYRSLIDNKNIQEQQPVPCEE